MPDALHIYAVKFRPFVVLQKLHADKWHYFVCQSISCTEEWNAVLNSDITSANLPSHIFTKFSMFSWCHRCKFQSSDNFYTLPAPLVTLSQLNKPVTETNRSRPQQQNTQQNHATGQDTCTKAIRSNSAANNYTTNRLSAIHADKTSNTPSCSWNC